jgi:hypothetical protein
MTHFSKYQSNGKRDVIEDFRQFNQTQFAAMLTPEILQTLFRKRNTNNGKQYRIVDLFKDEWIFYFSLFFDGDLVTDRHAKFYRQRQPNQSKSTVALYSLSIWFTAN